MPTSLGPAEILVILVVALIVLGPKRLPEAGRQVGRFVSEIRHWSSAVQAEIRDVMDVEGNSQPTPPDAPSATPLSAAMPPESPPLPTTSDAGTTAPAPAPTTRQTAAAEWGLPEPASPAEPPSPPAPEAPAPAAAIPPEWSTPPSTNGNK
jgi:sec-independent protein translocase protein TatA